MISIPPHTHEGKPHYTYTLSYPENYPDPEKAGTVFYVGKGKDDRINDHERQAKKGVRSHKCSAIRKIWTANCQVVKRKLAFFETHREACMYEIALIFFMNGLTNLTYGGDGATGLAPWNKGSKGLQVAWNKGITQSEEARRKNSDSHTGKPRPFTEEHKHNLKTSPKAIEQRHRLAEFNTGKPCPEKKRRKIRDAQKGVPRPLSEKNRERLVEYNKSRKGKPHPLSENGRQRMIEANKRRWEKARRNQALSQEAFPQEGVIQGLLFPRES